MKTDFKQVYLDRIKQINIDKKKAIGSKKWNIVAKLEAEKAELEEKIKKMEH